MQALEELPGRDKNQMLPVIQLGPWVGSHYLDSTLSRLEQAYGTRPFFADIAEEEAIENRRPVHDQLNELRNPRHGYDAWCEFIEERENFIPTIQYRELPEIEREVARLYELNRGLLVPIRNEAIRFSDDIVQIVHRATRGARDICFLLDYERATRDILGRQMATSAAVRSILRAAPQSVVAISASSFPDSFSSITDQDIYERFLFDGVAADFSPEQLIYSDRGSVRAERLTGGGGSIPPRVDYAQNSRWKFFRDDSSADKRIGYQRQAIRAMQDEGWDRQLRLWGTQMIERTSLGESLAITTPAKATAVRINIHLHRQLFYGDEDALYETDEEWTD